MTFYRYNIKISNFPKGMQSRLNMVVLQSSFENSLRQLEYFMLIVHISRESIHPEQEIVVWRLVNPCDNPES